MTLEQRLKQIGDPNPHLNLVTKAGQSEWDSPIHRLGGETLPKLVIHRLGTYSGSRI